MRARRTGLPLLQASVGLLPIGSHAVDAVILHDVLQHLPAGEEPRALSEAFRVLRPGGFLSIRANYGTPEGASVARHRRYDRKELARRVTSAGFLVEKHRVFHPLAAQLGRLRNARRDPLPHAETAGPEELAVRLPGRFVNSALDLYSRLEDALVARIPFALPFGDAQLLLARKPGQAVSPGNR